MKWLRALFGPSKEKIWRALAREMEGVYVDGGTFGRDAVQVRSGDWILTLDTYTVSTGNSTVTFTRMRAPFVNEEGLRFKIARAGLFHAVFGQSDIDTGDPLFDEEFVIEGNDPARIRELLAHEPLRRLMAAQPTFQLEVKDDEGWFGPDFPEGVDELSFAVTGVIKDLDRLRGLFEVFSEALARLCHMAKAYDDDLEFLIDDLLGPGGTVRSKILLWDGGPARHRALSGILEKGDGRAVPALVSVIDDEDRVLAAKAMLVLGSLGDRRAVAPLVARLGSFVEIDRRGAREYAAEALAALGRQDLVDAVEGALAGRVDGLAGAVSDERDAAALAFVHALATHDPNTIARAAAALAELGAVGALPSLRESRRVMKRAPDDLREAYEAAVLALDERASLPRPARAAPGRRDTLPRPADPEPGGTASLPRPSTPVDELGTDEEKP